MNYHPNPIDYSPHRKPDFRWTPDAVEQLTTLHAEGKSASIIAREMGSGLSRNAIIGKLHRLNLRMNSTVIDKGTPWTPQELEVLRTIGREKGGAEVSRLTGRTRQAIWYRMRLEDFKLPHGRRPDPPLRKGTVKTWKMACLPPPEGAVSFADWKPGTCAFPYGDPREFDDLRYCGSPCHDELSWCGPHARVVFKRRP